MSLLTVNNTTANVFIQPIADALAGATVSVYSSDETLLGTTELSDPAFSSPEDGVAEILNTPIAFMNHDVSGKVAQYATITKGDLFIQLGQRFGAAGVGIAGSGRQLILNSLTFSGGVVQIVNMNLKMHGVDSDTDAPLITGIYPEEGAYLEPGASPTLSIDVERALTVDFLYSYDGSEFVSIESGVDASSGSASVTFTDLPDGIVAIKYVVYWVGGFIEHTIGVTTDMGAHESVYFDIAALPGAYDDLRDTGLGWVMSGSHDPSNSTRKWSITTSGGKRIAYVGNPGSSRAAFLEMQPADAYRATYAMNYHQREGFAFGPASRDNSLAVYMEQENNVVIRVPDGDDIVFENVLTELSLPLDFAGLEVTWDRLNNTMKIRVLGLNMETVLWESDETSVPAVAGTYVGVFCGGSSSFYGRPNAPFIIEPVTV